MLKYSIFLAILPFTLFAFEPNIITPSPVLGFQELPFDDSRQLLAWYPVDPIITGEPSNSPWDLFQVAKNAPPASSQAKMAVIVISHGYTGNPHQLSWLIRGLVYHGFIVLGIEHRDLNNGKAHANHWQRARDVSQIIDRFSASSLAQAADLDKIGMAGFSLGGTTAIWVAGGRSSKLDSLIPTAEYAAPEDYVKADEALPTLNKEMMAKDWRDPRVKAAFIMAPAWAWLFDEASLRQIRIPIYLIAAAEDQVLVTRNNAGFFARHIPQAFYQAIPGKAGHYIFISALNNLQQKQANLKNNLEFLFKDDVAIDRSWIQFQVAEEAARFFKLLILEPVQNLRVRRFSRLFWLLFD